MKTRQLYVSICDTRLGKIQVLSLAPNRDIVRLDLIDFMTYFVNISKPKINHNINNIPIPISFPPDPILSGSCLPPHEVDNPDIDKLKKINVSPHKSLQLPAPITSLTPVGIYSPSLSSSNIVSDISQGQQQHSGFNNFLNNSNDLNQVSNFNLKTLFPAYSEQNKTTDYADNKKIISFLNKYKIDNTTHIIQNSDKTFSMYLNSYLNECSIDKKSIALGSLQELCVDQPMWIEALKNIPIGSVLSYQHYKEYIDYLAQKKSEQDYIVSTEVLSGASPQQISAVRNQISKKISSAALMGQKLLHNDIPLIFPCHRVVPQSALYSNCAFEQFMAKPTWFLDSAQLNNKVGDIGNYIFGEEAKRALLDKEQVEITN